MEKRGLSILALAILVGMVVGAFILGKSIERFKTDDRYISVKGFSEREVKADLAIWPLKIRMAVGDIQTGSKSMESARVKVIEFLTKNGINPEEIIRKNLTVVDKQAREYESANDRTGLRYILEETVEVRSNNVDQIQKVSRMTSDLLNAGVVLSSGPEWGGSDLKFIYTQLNSIKPDMLAEATVNAQKAAEQFAKNSNTGLGKMRKANQGLFTIMDRDISLSQSSGENYNPGSSSDITKNVRVVISVEYAIR
ncbi:MAG: SIMPL domain-containing protein [Bacteroidetes bacterium]|nr:SIMPL domain-containing protein [Bacteroidota bacterium]